MSPPAYTSLTQSIVLQMSRAEVSGSCLPPLALASLVTLSRHTSNVLFLKHGTLATTPGLGTS